VNSYNVKDITQTFMKNGAYIYITDNNVCHLFGHCFQGLVVPVIRNVETMNFADIEKSINALGEKVNFLCIMYMTS